MHIKTIIVLLVGLALASAISPRHNSRERYLRLGGSEPAPLPGQVQAAGTGHSLESSVNWVMLRART